MSLADQYPEEVLQVCEQHGVPVEMMKELLGLRERHPNLHALGADLALRKDINRILDRYVPLDK